MIKKLNNRKPILILKYIYILFFILSFGENYKEVTSLRIALLLIYLINNQLRCFIFYDKKLYKIFSLIFEMIISFYFLGIGGQFSSLIFVPTIIDIVCTYNAYTSITFILIIFVLLIFKVNLDLIVKWLIFVIPIFILLIRTKDIEERKITAQVLYDEIREKEEKLKIANEELENYANTIEEIAILRERNRISREIHDDVGHALSTIIIQLNAIEKLCYSNQEQASNMIKNLAAFTKISMENVRNAVHAMKPRQFEEYEGIISISEMIKNFEKLTGINVNLRVSEKMWKLNSDQTMVLYRIIQEFLSNSIRHGKATEVKIFMNFLDDSLRVHLKDNGIGCLNIIPGMGLESIKDRVAVWGGEIEYFSTVGNGFELIVTIEKAKLSVDGV